MALILLNTYPGQVLLDGAYPQGKARNEATEGDGIGTPWEAQIVNDMLGFQQSLLFDAGITPSGVPDNVGASDYLDSLKRIVAFPCVGRYYGGNPFNPNPTVWGPGDPLGGIPTIAVQQGAASTAPIWFRVATPWAKPVSAFSLLKNLEIDGFGVRIKPSASHVALPTVMPKITVYSWPGDGPIATDPILDETDGSADVPTYEAEHTIENSAPINKNISTEGYHEFWIKINGEAGTNYIAGLSILGVWISTKNELP